jgi:hypothetical protein
VFAGEDKYLKDNKGSPIPAFHIYTVHVSSAPAYKSQYGYDNSADINFSFPFGLIDSSIFCFK